MKKTLDYGRKTIELDIPDQHLLYEILPISAEKKGTNGRKIVEDALEHPVGSERLAGIIHEKQARNAVVIVNDITRPTPYGDILPPLLEEIEQAGILRENITLVVATGIHRPHDMKDNLEAFGAEICQNYRIENHNCDGNLTSAGRLSNGLDLLINRTAAEADLLVTTGLVGLHYFAGYSGGRKSILPGIASRSVIEFNHKMMSDERAHLGNYENNPVSDLMIEAARTAGVDFIVNVVTQGHKDLVYCAAGDLEEAWLDAVHYCEDHNVVSIGQKADIVIAGCGGYPKDINMYQSQKALDAAALAVKPGGTVLLAAECSEGLGEEKFKQWLDEAQDKQDIVERFFHHFELGGHKAYAIVRTLDIANVKLYSSLPESVVEKLYLKPVHNLQIALNELIDQYGPQATIIFMPQAPRIAVKVQKDHNE